MCGGTEYPHNHSRQSCCPLCESESETDEKGTYTYGCKNLLCECHFAWESEEPWISVYIVLTDMMEEQMTVPEAVKEIRELVVPNWKMHAKAVKAGEKMCLHRLLEMADRNHAEELRQSVTYYAQEHDIKL